MSISQKAAKLLLSVAFRNRAVAKEIEEVLNSVTDPADITAITDRLDVLEANFNALLAKLDADAGVTDEDYESTLEIV